MESFRRAYDMLRALVRVVLETRRETKRLGSHAGRHVGGRPDAARHRLNGR